MLFCHSLSKVITCTCPSSGHNYTHLSMQLLYLLLTVLQTNRKFKLTKHCTVQLKSRNFIIHVVCLMKESIPNTLGLFLSFIDMFLLSDLYSAVHIQNRKMLVPGLAGYYCRVPEKFSMRGIKLEFQQVNSHCFHHIIIN